MAVTRQGQEQATFSSAPARSHLGLHLSHYPERKWRETDISWLGYRPRDHPKRGKHNNKARRTNAHCSIKIGNVND